MALASGPSPSASPGPGAGPNESILPSVAKWGEATLQLKELASQTTVPTLVKVTKGQYRNIGVAKSVHSDLYLHSVRTTRKVLAEGVKVKDNKRLLQTDQRFSMPVTYQGWFEIMSEDGKAIKALHNVMELARLFPHSCLVRDNIKAYIPRENGEVGLDRTRNVQAGELLTLAGEITISVGGKQKDATKRLLKCFDAKGDSVYLGFDQKGMFSPVAGQTNISGVHTIKALIEKFRFPILVRLVHGIIPTKVEKTFTGVFRLTSVFSDETAFVCPLTKDAKMVPISTREPLKVSLATNFSKLQDLDDTKFFHQRCSHMIGSYMNSIHVLVSMPDPSLLKGGKDAQVSKGASHPPGPQRQKSRDHNATIERSPEVQTAAKGDPEEEDILFDEVDDVYAYVRRGGEPPPPRPRPEKKSDTDKATAKVMANSAEVKSTKPTAAIVPKLLSNPLKSKKKESATSKGDNISGENITWEEPIYEDLNKIREKKKVQEIEQTIVFEGGYGPDAAGTLPVSPKHMLPQASPVVRGKQQAAGPTNGDMKFTSLREVIKQSQGDQPVVDTPAIQPTKPTGYHQHPEANPPAIQTEPEGPPIPPKMFVDSNRRLSGGSQSNVQKLGLTSVPSPPPLPQSNALSTGMMKVSIHDATSNARTNTAVVSPSPHKAPGGLRPTVNTSGSPVGPRTSGISPSASGGNVPLSSTPNNAGGLPAAASSNPSSLHANHLVYKPASRPRPTQLLPTAPPPQRPMTHAGGVQNTGPQYVAVARVGDVVHSPGGTGAMVTNTKATQGAVGNGALNHGLNRNGRFQANPLFLS